MKYQVVSANEWMYPDQRVDETGRRSVELVAARNSYACAQILVETGREPFTWEFISDLPMPMEAPELYTLLPVYVEYNTGERGFTIPHTESAEYVTRKAPFLVYDAMQPTEKTFETPSGVTSAGLYIRWPTAQRTPGLYGGTLRLRQGGKRADIPIRIAVAAAAVPATETLRLTNWFSLPNMAKYHQLEMWSEEHWQMIERYGRLMREARQTDFQVSAGLAEYTRLEDGTYQFHFERTERFIRLYLGLGFRYLNGGTPIFREDWAAASFVVNIDGRHYPALSEETYAFLSAYFRGWYSLLRENGWDSITIQHVGDEPQADCAGEYRILAGLVRKFMPGIPLIEAVEIAELDGAVDIWVPKNNTYIEQQASFERKRRLGDDLWYYTCCCPGGRYLNRLLDGALLRTRYIHWANYRYDLSGYLHWGLNHYECTDDPFTGRAGCIDTLSTSSLPCGDSHIVYPLGTQILRSVRFEAMRAGCEDYELLRLLQQQDRAAADELAGSCVQSFTEYAEDAAVFDEIYKRLLRLLSDTRPLKRNG